MLTCAVFFDSPSQRLQPVLRPGAGKNGGVDSRWHYGGKHCILGGEGGGPLQLGNQPVGLPMCSTIP